MKKYTKSIGLALIVISLILSIFLSIPTLSGKNFSLSSTYGEKKVTLRGTYYNANSDYTVVVCPGYSCDRQKWRPVADLLVHDGYNTVLFDYSGQGESDGVIGFDNAKTDNIPKEIDDVIEYVHEEYKTDYEKIILLGHSMGGRSILRLLYDYNNPGAVTSVNRKNIKSVILLSPEVNYSFNAQASLFAGTSDIDEEPWKSYGRNDVGDTKIFLFGSNDDDIVSAEDIYEIANRTGARYAVEDGVLHSYMMYSPKFMRHIQNSLTDITGVKGTYNVSLTGINYLVWVLALIGIYLFVSGFESKSIATSLVLTDSRKFVLSKLLMWIPGMIVAVLVCSLCVVLPFGSPVMNLPYMNFICGYGLIMALAYKFKWIKGVEGKTDKVSFNIDLNSIGIFIGIYVYVIVILKCGMYNLLPLNIRLFWLLFCSLFMSVGYYISSIEKDIIKGKNLDLIYNIIQYIPLFLLVGFYLVLKSYSGMIGQMVNMIFMYMVCIPVGRFVEGKSENRLLGALTSSIMFQTFMITSAALIAIF